MFNKIAAAIAGPSRSPATSTQTMASRANVLVEALKDPAQQRSCHNQSKALSKELGALGEAHFGVFAQARPALQKVLQATQGDPAYEHLHQAAGTCDQRMLPVLFAAMSRQGDALMPTFTALRASPNGAVRGAIESLILGRHPGDAMAATRPPSPPQVPVEPAARPRPAASAGWLGSLSPRAILHGAFDEKEPAMRGLSTSERRALRTFTDGIVATQEGQNEALKFLAFVTNTAEAAPDAAADEGMHSPAAISMMLKSLYTAASQATLSPEEKVLVKRLLNDYRNLFISSAINKYFGKSKSYASHEEHMRRVVLQMAFAPKGGGLLSTGFSGHATVTRVATMDESSRRHQDVSRGLLLRRSTCIY